MATKKKTTRRRRARPVINQDVALLGGSAQVRRAGEARLPDRLGPAGMRSIIRGLGSPFSRMGIGAPHVILSAQVPWVEDRGYLNAINPRTVWSDSPNMGFIPPPYGGNIEGRLEVWLLGLTVGASYFLEFRLGAAPAHPDQPAHWEFKSSQGAPSTVTASFPNQNVTLLLHQVDGNMELARLSGSGLSNWIFYDVTVTELN